MYASLLYVGIIYNYVYKYEWMDGWMDGCVFLHVASAAGDSTGDVQGESQFEQGTQSSYPGLHGRGQGSVSATITSNTPSQLT